MIGGRLFGALALCIVAIDPLAAAAGMTTTIDNSEAPVKITACAATLRGEGGIPAAYVAFAVNFVNQSSQAATAIRFDFRLLDAFGQLLVVQPADKLGTFSPSVAIGNPFGSSGATWSTGNGTPAVTSVSCSVAMVRFVDGSIWQRPNSAIEPTMPALAP